MNCNEVVALSVNLLLMFKILFLARIDQFWIKQIMTILCTSLVTLCHFSSVLHEKCFPLMILQMKYFIVMNTRESFYPHKHVLPFPCPPFVANTLVSNKHSQLIVANQNVCQTGLLHLMEKANWTAVRTF